MVTRCSGGAAAGRAPGARSRRPLHAHRRRAFGLELELAVQQVEGVGVARARLEDDLLALELEQLALGQGLVLEARIEAVDGDQTEDPVGEWMVAGDHEAYRSTRRLERVATILQLACDTP